MYVSYHLNFKKVKLNLKLNNSRLVENLTEYFQKCLYSESPSWLAESKLRFFIIASKTKNGIREKIQFSKNTFTAKILKIKYCRKMFKKNNKTETHIMQNNKNNKNNSDLKF